MFFLTSTGIYSPNFSIFMTLVDTRESSNTHMNINSSILIDTLFKNHYILYSFEWIQIELYLVTKCKTSVGIDQSLIESTCQMWSLTFIFRFFHGFNNLIVVIYLYLMFLAFDNLHYIVQVFSRPCVVWLLLLCYVPKNNAFFIYLSRSISGLTIFIIGIIPNIIRIMQVALRFLFNRNLNSCNVPNLRKEKFW